MCLLDLKFRIFCLKKDEGTLMTKIYFGSYFGVLLSQFLSPPSWTTQHKIYSCTKWFDAPKPPQSSGQERMSEHFCVVGDQSVSETKQSIRTHLKRDWTPPTVTQTLAPISAHSSTSSPVGYGSLSDPTLPHFSRPKIKRTTYVCMTSEVERNENLFLFKWTV